MTWLRRISPGRSAPAGLEWRLWRRLPAITLWGLGLLGLALLWQWAQFPDAATPAQERAYGLTVCRPGRCGDASCHLRFDLYVK